MQRYWYKPRIRNYPKTARNARWPVRGGPRVHGQQAFPDALHSFCRDLWVVQETDHLFDDVCVPQDQTDHDAPLQTARLHEHVEEVPEEQSGG